MKDHFTKLGEFTEEMDSKLLRQIDSYTLNNRPNIVVQEIDEYVLEPHAIRLSLSGEEFKDVPASVIEMRIMLFIKFTRKFFDSESWIKAMSTDKDDSIGKSYMSCKNLVLATLKNKMLD